MGARTVSRRAYSYRPDGNLTAVADHLSGVRTFDLDSVGRVTQVSAQGWSESCAYDSAGNQTSATWPASHPGHVATGIRTQSGTALARAGAVRFEYDARGRITLRQTPSWHRRTGRRAPGETGPHATGLRRWLVREGDG
jgi:YD repeat-containing protein